MRHPYPPVLNQHLAPFYLRYLFSLHAQHIMSPVVKGYLAKIRGKTEMPIYYDIPNTGQILAPAVDKFIEEHAEAYRNDPRFEEKIESVTGDNMNGAVEDITQMVNLLKAHGIRSIFFINPPYKNWFLNLNLDDFGRFEKELAGLTDFYDFSGLNSITRDAYNFYNPSHYGLPIGNIMLARMLDYKGTTVPADFGVLVTSENVEAHLQQLREQVAAEMKGSDTRQK